MRSLVLCYFFHFFLFFFFSLPRFTVSKLSKCTYDGKSESCVKAVSWTPTFYVGSGFLLSKMFSCVCLKSQTDSNNRKRIFVLFCFMSLTGRNQAYLFGSLCIYEISSIYLN